MFRKQEQHPWSSCHHPIRSAYISWERVASCTCKLLWSINTHIHLSYYSWLLTSAFKTKDNLLGSLGLLVENGLGLTTITGLLTVVTSLTLSEQRGLTSLVLSDLVGGVLSALGALTVGVTCLGNVDLFTVLKHAILTRWTAQEGLKRISRSSSVMLMLPLIHMTAVIANYEG